MLKKVVREIISLSKPVCVFFYGSRARGDDIIGSDYEIGVVYKKEDYVARKDLKDKLDFPNVNIYPFHYEDLINGNIDTPFPKKIYMKELITTSKILFGESIFEEIETPDLKVIDLIEDVRFCLGYSLAAVVSFRNDDFSSATNFYYKSNLFGTRALLAIFGMGMFYSYKEIFEKSKLLEIKDEYKKLIENAYDIRLGNAKIDQNLLYKNINFLNQIVEPELLGTFERQGNKKVD